jgi:hypothetical protein
LSSQILTFLWSYPKTNCNESILRHAHSLCFGTYNFENQSSSCFEKEETLKAIVESCHILALQGIDLNSLSLLQASLRGHSIHYIPRQAPDNGCGMAFVVQSQVSVLSTQGRYFIKMDGGSDTRMSFTIIIEWEGKRMAIAQAIVRSDNNPPHQHRGLYQMKQFLAGLPSRITDGVVICGDWNAQNTHPVLQEVFERGMVDSYQDNKPEFGAAKSRKEGGLHPKYPKPFQYICHNTAISSEVVNSCKVEQALNGGVLDSLLLLNLGWAQ